MGLKIRIVTPGGHEGPWRGNRATAGRWERILADLGHAPVVEESLGGEADLLVALHARKSAASISRFAGPVIVALTGTDLYLERGDPRTAASIERADRLIVLQPRALDALSPEARAKARVVHQSCEPVSAPAAEEGFQVAVVAHLRAVKDPLLTAEALRRLPASSPVRVVHAGAAIDEELGARARELARVEPRYRWLGAATREEALALIARSRLLSLTSRAEGGANVVTEALASDTPIVSTHIEGSIGLLGEDYPGYVPVGDAGALARLLARAAGDPSFYGELLRRCRERRGLADPTAEREAWRRLLEELGVRS